MIFLALFRHVGAVSFFPEASQFFLGNAAVAIKVGPDHFFNHFLMPYFRNVQAALHEHMFAHVQFLAGKALLAAAEMTYRKARRKYDQQHNQFFEEMSAAASAS